MKKYQTGGVASGALGQSSSLSPWAGPYVTEMLGKGAALADMPYQPYMGPLTAGQSPLQTQAFQGLANLTVPTAAQTTYTPMSFTGSSFAQPMAQQPMGQQQFSMPSTGGFRLPTEAERQLPKQNARPIQTMEEMITESVMRPITQQPTTRPTIGLGGPAGTLGTDGMVRDASGNVLMSGGFPSQAPATQAQPQAQLQAQPQAQPSPTNIFEQYMSPFLQGALDPQYAAAQRQADIAAQNLQSQYGKAGAYGGSRQGVAEAELQRGLLDRMAGITGTGYQQAFEQAQRQFNTEQDRAMQAARQAQQYGLETLGAQRLGGAEQRAIEGQGIAADIAQFTEERDYPYKQVQYMQSLLQGLPISTQDYQYAEPSTLSNVMGGASGILGLLETMGLFGKKG